MKIKIDTNSKNKVIVIPNSLLFNKMTLSVAKKKQGGQYIPDISVKELRQLRKTIKQMKKIHKDWVLVDVVDNKGTKVRVEL